MTVKVGSDASVMRESLTDPQNMLGHTSWLQHLKHIPRESSYPPVPVFGLHEQIFQKRPNCQSNSQIRHQIAA